MAATSKITAKGQTTVPQDIRDALGAKPGDALMWELQADGRVAVRRILPVDLEYLKAVEGTLSEWHTAEDEAAYGKL